MENGGAAVEVGVQMIFQSYGYEGVSDGQVYDEEIRLGVLAEELGFDALWPVEHHFDDYSFCPDNTQFLSYMAARTERIRLGTGAVILPWNDPLRVAEKVSLLDHLSGGRVLFGMGRGLARMEYEPFAIDMETSRDRFDEAADMILDALETGWLEGKGPYYERPRTPVRPRPERSFAGRTYCVAMSPDSVEAAARLGARMVMFSQRPFDQHLPAIERWREGFREQHDAEPPPPITCDFVYCDADPDRAEAGARRYLPAYLASVLQHYELMSDHFRDLKGYETYGQGVDVLRAVGLGGMSDAYLAVQAWGTPDQILERLDTRRRLVGDFDLTCCFRYAGLPYEEAERSMRLFAAEVIPVVHAW
jgi:alkanesulfonate monooxygenase SsuD/methylene tetrahydromethanopterin reductase-like flavin-dependent oxidoreductase (luciferase family)